MGNVSFKMFAHAFVNFVLHVFLGVGTFPFVVVVVSVAVYMVLGIFVDGGGERCGLAVLFSSYIGA